MTISIRPSKNGKRGFPAKIRSETPNRESKNDASTTLTPFLSQSHAKFSNA
jgi:hypothetical protein